MKKLYMNGESLGLIYDKIRVNHNSRTLKKMPSCIRKVNLLPFNAGNTNGDQRHITICPWIIYNSIVIVAPFQQVWLHTKLPPILHEQQESVRLIIQPIIVMTNYRKHLQHMSNYTGRQKYYGIHECWNVMKPYKNNYTDYWLCSSNTQSQIYQNVVTRQRNVHRARVTEQKSAYCHWEHLQRECREVNSYLLRRSSVIRIL